MKPNEFVKTFLPFALETEAKKEINHKFILAQAALESGWGKSAPGNMFFGVKASSSTPESQRQILTTTEILSHPDGAFPEIISITKQPNGKYKYRIKDWFRKYESPEESFTDHADFFFKNKRYTKALEVKHDPYKFAEEIAKAGYATDPNYANSLKAVIAIIEKCL